MLRPGRHKLIPEKQRTGTKKSDGSAASNEPVSETKGVGLRLGHEQMEVAQRPSRSSPLPWNRAVPTHRRERATEGLLLGCAVAEALSLNRNDLHPRVALKMFGRNPLSYRFQPGFGVTSHRTHSLLMSFQAILQSKADPKILAPNLRNRIAWYQRGFLFRHIYTHLKRIGPSFGNPHFDNSMTVGLADDPLVRSLALSIALQGVADSASTWFQLSVGISHADPRVLCASTLVGFAGQLAQMTNQEEFRSIDILNRLIDVTEDPQLNANLLELRDALTKNRSVSSVALQMGWKNGLPNNVYASAIIGIYAWLRHPKRFRTCVERTILLGGACSNAAVVAGGLSGISLGAKAIPTEWRNRVSIAPHTDQWREMLIERVKDWPHGVEDIHRTQALPSMVLGQIGRNITFTAFRILHGLIRLPMKAAQFSVTNRVVSKNHSAARHPAHHAKRTVTEQ